MYLVQRSDTSRGVYPMAAFMTVFAQHPAAFIRGQLLSRPRLLTGKLWYLALQYLVSAILISQHIYLQTSVIRMSKSH